MFRKLFRKVVHLCPPVEKPSGLFTHSVGNADRVVRRVQKTPVGNAYFEIVFIGAERAHDAVCDRNYLGIRLNSRDTNDIGVQLPVLPYPAPLRTLIPENIRDGIPAGWKGDLTSSRGYHAGKGRRHFRSQCHLAVSSVGERVRLLIHYLFRGLTAVELGRLQNRSIIFLVTEKLADALHVFKNVFLKELLLGIEIPYTFVALGRKLFISGHSSLLYILRAGDGTLCGRQTCVELRARARSRRLRPNGAAVRLDHRLCDEEPVSRTRWIHHGRLVAPAAFGK